ncbi:hypothetical protein KSC_029170 [Ktedonobacter sp. SOSP1-52]|nr:hypothetical protein KSC_029170 [Ktedonobacter sp. SOSP1-52]
MSIDPHILTYSGHSNTTSDAAWSPDGTRVASSGWLDGGTVQIWNAATGKTLQTCKIEHPVQGIFPLDVVWSEDSKHVLSFVGWDHNMILADASHIVEMVQVWDAGTGQRVRSIPVMKPIMTPINESGTSLPLTQRWALNSRYVATSHPSNHNMLEIWDIATGNSQTVTLGTGHPDATVQVLNIFWAPDKETLAINCNTQDTSKEKFYQTIEIWNATTGERINTLRPDNAYAAVQILNISWAPDNATLAIGLEKGAEAGCEIWSALTGKRLQTFKPSLYWTRSMSWSPDGRFLTLGTDIYNVETGNRITTYKLQGMLGSLVWSPDGRRVALVDAVKHGAGFSSTSSTLFVLDALSGKPITQYAGRGLFGNSGTNGNLIWSPDGKRVMVVSQYIDIWRGE